ncbi:DUF4230 domain-containing protein [Galbibacter sp. EGI 63066]|uniref:DUF4230 domain-containing protein n=1 Tax=Galbibacter sp. EGI 63066 TaxID=2993559 RepID=UPI002249416D|nr:DUF4230 domain-containing protein [Galbibacter sp. EGI 63066]MCX2679416.1 DUF4230 domain-containing protein [Galbibacter sp. EGI 63066]
MRKILFGVVITLLLLLVFQWYKRYEERNAYLEESTQLIRQQVNNVGKLVVTEGHFSEVYNYKQSEKILANLWTTEKRALVVVNADVSIAYDLSKLEFEIDEENKTLYITTIPEPELKIAPDLKYYDISSDYLNPFNADDFNKIKSNVMKSVRGKIDRSGLKENAGNRLISELSKFYILTNSLGWKLVYNQQEINSSGSFETLKWKD